MMVRFQATGVDIRPDEAEEPEGMGAITIEQVKKAVADAVASAASPWMDTPGAAVYLGCQPATLKTWRARGEGPRYRIMSGKLVRYHRDDLDAFVIGDADAEA
jgi:hypothetical protein